MTNQTQAKLNSFAEDVEQGLSSSPKFLSSKYFYDDKGSELFRQIMELPEYYPTRAEAENFSAQCGAIVEAFTAQGKPLDLIELGAGDGTKTAILIECLQAQNIDFTYSPIDISAGAVETLTDKFKKLFPDLNVNALCGDYFRILESLKSQTDRTKIVFFLGSNIGNFSLENGIDFLRGLRREMNENDLLFIGFDLQKDPRTILRAYDDSEGVTAEFNLNLLDRINRELGGNFKRENFSHYAVYSPIDGAARSFLISGEKQTVYIECLNKEFEFDRHEAIFMEVSQKYTLSMIEEFAAESGFEVAQNFCNEKYYFADSLWKAV
jgi:L-histidine N-alpha-methyltransferase